MTVKGLAATYPSYDSIGTTLHRRMRKSLPSLAGNAEDLQIPQSYSQTLSGEEFLTIDRTYQGRGGQMKRMLIFCSDRCLRLLAGSQIWCFDGRFDSCPSQFTQLFVIHGICSGLQVP